MVLSLKNKIKMLQTAVNTANGTELWGRSRTT